MPHNISFNNQLLFVFFPSNFGRAHVSQLRTVNDFPMANHLIVLLESSTVTTKNTMSEVVLEGANVLDTLFESKELSDFVVTARDEEINVLWIL